MERENADTLFIRKEQAEYKITAFWILAENLIYRILLFTLNLKTQQHEKERKESIQNRVRSHDRKKKSD